jgi:hypothetical protein
LIYTPNPAGQIQWHGDSGGSCFSSGLVTGINSTCAWTWSPLAITSCVQTGPQEYLPWANPVLAQRGPAQTVTSTSSNTSADSVYINDVRTNGSTANDVVEVTANYNPAGEMSANGVYDNADIGVWYDSFMQQWAVFNEDTSDMPVGNAFNYVVNPQGSSVQTGE